jgi:hypothetical protein
MQRDLIEHILATTDPTLRAAVFAEDSAALAGLLIAAASLAAQQLTGSPVPDAAGSIVIGTARLPEKLLTRPQAASPDTGGLRASCGNDAPAVTHSDMSPHAGKLAENGDPLAGSRLAGWSSWRPGCAGLLIQSSLADLTVRVSGSPQFIVGSVLQHQQGVIGTG